MRGDYGLRATERTVLRVGCPFHGACRDGGPVSRENSLTQVKSAVAHWARAQRDTPLVRRARADLRGPLPPEQQDQVAAFARPLHLSRGEIVYMAGSDLPRLLVVHRGRIAMRHLTADGREQVVRVLEEGDVVGEAAFVTGAQPNHEAVATADSEALARSTTRTWSSPSGVIRGSRSGCSRA